MGGRRGAMLGYESRRNFRASNIRSEVPQFQELLRRTCLEFKIYISEYIYTCN